MTEFIIVGRGLAATTLMHTFYSHGISFKVVGDATLSSSSRVAAGIWNPIVFKRLTKSWLADDLISYLNHFYGACETRLNKKIITQRPIIKPFTEEQEKTLWKKKAEGELASFLDPQIHGDIAPEMNQCVLANGYAKVKNSGNLNMLDFLDSSADFFKEYLLNEVFDYNQLQILPEKVIYQGMEAKHIIFCEGYLVKDNPFFNWIPLKPAKGEVLTIEAPELQFKNAIFNRNGFLMDLSAGVYKAGATYAWDDLTETPTSDGLAELRSKIGNMIRCGYRVVKHEAGVRPSSSDRRPIIGEHPKHKQLFVFNGLGTKGVMLAPFFAENFVNFYLQKEEIHKDVDVKRFYHLHEDKK